MPSRSNTPSRSLTLLGGFTCIALLACWIVISQRYDVVEPEYLGGGFVFPKLGSSANTVKEIEITRANGSFVLTLEEGGWVNDGISGFSVLPDRVEEVIVSMTTLKYLEPKTTRVELYNKLDVEDVYEDSKSTQLSLRNMAGEVLASVIVGRVKESNTPEPELYIRLDGSERAWLVEGSLDVRYDAIHWSDTKIIDIPSDTVETLVVQHADGEVVALGREDKTQMTLENLPLGTEIQHQYQIDFLAGLLESVTFIDAKFIDHKNTKRPQVFKVTISTSDLLKITLTTSEPEEDGSIWVSFDALVSNDQFVTDQVKREVQRINTDLSNWNFKLPRKFTDRLKLRRSDIVATLTTNN